MSSACSYVYADKFTACVQNVRPERVHASERLLRSRPTFSETVMVSVGVSKLAYTEFFFCRAGGENKRCVLPRCAADAEVIAMQSLGRYQGMSSCFSRIVLQHTVLVRQLMELLRPETRRTLFHRNSGHRTVQILSRWITKSGLQCSSASTKQRFEMLTNCYSVC